MKDDLNASEKRLIAALDRIDLIIDRAAASGGAALADPQQAPAGDDALAAALAECRARLTEAGAEAARLAQANAALVQANAALLQGQPGAAEIRQAFEAELEALRAARAAEIGQVGDIIGTLDRLLADADAADPGADIVPAPEPARPAMVETPMPIEPAAPDNAASETASASAGPAGEAAAQTDRG